MGWKRIIVGVDSTPESLRAVEQAARIASAAHGLLFPVHAVPATPAFTGIIGAEPMPGYSPGLRRELLRLSEEQVTRSLERVAAGRHVEVQTGPAPFVIGEEARQRRADLVVLGGKQHGALVRGLGRTTAHYLVRTLEVPILIVGSSTAPIKRVLAAVDLSPASMPTIRAAQRLAALLHARLRVMHVVEPFRFTDLAPDLWDEDVYRQQAEEAFRRFASPLEDVETKDCVVRYGAPVDEIGDEALAWQADVVVIGSHGTGWVDRILLGSTTQRLVSEPPASLLVVPMKRVAGMLKLTRLRAKMGRAKRAIARSRRR